MRIVHTVVCPPGNKYWKLTETSVAPGYPRYQETNLSLCVVIYLSQNYLLYQLHPSFSSNKQSLCDRPASLND